MPELRKLDAYHPSVMPVPTEVAMVTMPLIVEAWKVELWGHPDRE